MIVSVVIPLSISSFRNLRKTCRLAIYCPGEKNLKQKDAWIDARPAGNEYPVALATDNLVPWKVVVIRDSYISFTFFSIVGNA